MKDDRIMIEKKINSKLNFQCALFILTTILSLSLFTAAQKNEMTNKIEIRQPEVFGADIFSGGEVFRGTFTPDGRTFYFFKKVTQDQEDYRIFVSKLVNGQWSEPVRVNLGGEYSDLYPFISKDGKRMVFTSYRPAPGDTSSKPNAYLWYVDKKGDGWGNPVFMSKANTFSHYHSGVEIGSDGTIYFRRITPDWKQKETLFSRWNGKEYEAPQLFELVEQLRKKYSNVPIGGGSLSPDGKLIFLDVSTTNPQTGKSASDIWISLKNGQEWTPPKPLGAGINSDGYDVFPFISPDGKDFYFVRNFTTFYRIPLKIAIDSVTTKSEVLPPSEKHFFSVKGSLPDAERAFAQMSVEVGQKEAFVEFLGDWGMQFGPEPITAKANFANEPATVLPQKRVLYWEPYYGDVSVADDLGFNIGPWVVKDTVEQKVLGQGYFLSIWKRLPDGTWREYVDMGIRVPAPTADHSFGKPFEAAREIKPAAVVKPGAQVKIPDLEQKLTTLSQSKGLLEAYRKMLDEKTVMLRFGTGLLKDNKAVADFMTAAGFDRLPVELTPLDSDFSKKGDLAYSYGKYQIGSNDNIAEKGFYVHVWRRDSKGEWKIAAANLAPLPEYLKKAAQPQKKSD
jgi:hypothetical protein